MTKPKQDSRSTLKRSLRRIQADLVAARSAERWGAVAQLTRAEIAVVREIERLTPLEPPPIDPRATVPTEDLLVELEALVEELPRDALERLAAAVTARLDVLS